MTEIWVEMQTDNQRERQTDTQERHTNSQTYVERKIDKERQTCEIQADQQTDICTECETDRKTYKHRGTDTVRNRQTD